MGKNEKRPTPVALDFLEQVLRAGGGQAKTAFAKILDAVRPYGRANTPSDTPGWSLLPPDGNRDTFREVLKYQLEEVKRLRDAESNSPWPTYRRWAKTLDNLASEIEASRGSPLDPSRLFVEPLRTFQFRPPHVEATSADREKEENEKRMLRWATFPRIARAVSKDLRTVSDKSNRRNSRPLLERERHFVEAVEMATGKPYLTQIAILLLAEEMLAQNRTAATDPFFISPESVYSRTRALAQARRREVARRLRKGREKASIE